jgi:hypothetical protein
MHNPSGFGSDNVLPRPFGFVNWCIIEMEVEASKRLLTLAVAEIPFNARQNRTDAQKNSASHPGRQSKETLDAGRRPNTGNQAFDGLNFLCFSSRKSFMREIGNNDCPIAELRRFGLPFQIQT